MNSSPAPSPLLRVFVLTVGTCGILVIAHCLAVIGTGSVPSQWLVFAGLTLVGGRFSLKVPSIEARFSVSEMFAFTCLLLFGPEAGAITLAIDSAVLSWHRGMTRDQTLFNFGNLALSAWIAGTVFFAAAGAPPLYTSTSISEGLLPALGLMAVTYFVLNSGFTAAAIALTRGERPWTLWRAHFLWLGPGYAASASVSMLMVVALRQVHFSILALLPPVIIVAYAMLRSSFGRLEDAKAHVAKLNHLYLSTVETLATAIDAKDEVTHGHVRRVQLAVVALARELGVRDENTLRAVEAAALLHDTGKLAIPEHILNKPGKLTPAEFEKMKLHAPIGAEILSSIDFPYPVVPIVRHHHENWDGTGYPDRLRGEEIPIGARLLAVVDCYDALISDRPYRRAMTDDQAVAILRQRRGTMYDPAVVDVFLAARHRLMPPREEKHPAGSAVTLARSLAVGGSPQGAAPDPGPTARGASEEVLAISSLARAVSGQASIADVGALTWMLLRQVVPAQTMAMYVPDERRDALVCASAAGTHGEALRGLVLPIGSGLSGWVAANRRPIMNAEAGLDLDRAAVPGLTLLRSALAVPLLREGRLVAVLSFYSPEAQPFSDDHARLIDVLSPRLAEALVDAPGPEAAVPQRRGELRLLKPTRETAGA